jgi:hypothetical protein
MTIPNFRSTEALYLIIVREKNAEQLLREWARDNNSRGTIENNRMKLYENQSLNLFQVNWSHNWNNVTIWDYWNRRHINCD